MIGIIKVVFITSGPAINFACANDAGARCRLVSRAADDEGQVHLSRQACLARDGERVRVDVRDRAGLTDQVAGPEMPPQVGVFEREGAEEEREREERDEDQRVENT